MVFSSINPLFQLDDPPNWQQQPPGGSVSDINNDNNRIPHATPPPQPMHLPQGLSIRPNPIVLDQRSRSTKLPQQETAHKCPRCASLNTKFCYYNNYSLSQPRYFCKTCRRYWTKGGTLRNVPVGGGLRRNKKSKRSRVKSPVTGNNYSGVASSSCTTDNMLGPSVLPHIPLLPSLNFVSDVEADDQNISSLSFRRFQPLTNTFMSDHYNQWRMQEFGFTAGLQLPSAGVYQLGSEGVGEVPSTDQYGSKTTVDFCSPNSSQVELVKFEENEGFMNLPRNFMSFPEYEQQQFCSNGDASDGLNISSTGHHNHLL